MWLPNSAKAVVPQAKVAGYLLKETHPVGGPKAKFFRSHGFSDENARLLEVGLLEIARTREVSEQKESRHGRKYVLVGELTTPSGAVVTVRTVWIVEKGEEAPRFVTAYPE